MGDVIVREGVVFGRGGGRELRCDIYAPPGLTDDHQALMPSDLQLPLLPEKWQPAARMGAARSVFFAAEDVMVDAKATSLRDARLWAGGKLLVWTAENKGDRKSFRIPVAATGRKQIHVAFAMTPQSGEVAFRLDGRKLQLANKADTLDLHVPYRTLLRSVALMPAELEAGDHTLTLELADVPDGAVRPEIGIDFIWVQDR